MELSRDEIIKEYVNLCIFTGEKPNTATSRKNFLNLYMGNYVKMHGIKDFDRVQKDAILTLKRNTLTIKYLYDKEKEAAWLWIKSID